MAGERKIVGIIGGGIAGLGAAWLLDDVADVTLYEAEPALGGHARTIDVATTAGPVPVDVGVVVADPWTYPNLFALFDLLGASTLAVQTAFGASFGPGGSWVAGRLDETPLGRRIEGECARFELDMVRAANLPASQQQLPLGHFVAARNYSDEFLYGALAPVMAHITLTPCGVLEMPVALCILVFREYFSFFSTTTWRIPRFGARQHIQGLAARFSGRALLGTPVSAVARLPDGVLVTDARGRRAIYDEVILATRADVALGLLTDPTSREADLLGAFSYHRTGVSLHRDRSLLSPDLPRAAPQYVHPDETIGPRLRGRITALPRPDLGGESPLITYSWGSNEPPPRDLIAALDDWTHHAPTAATLAARDRIHEIQGRARTWFCGAYTILGIHEAALVSGMAVAEALGARYPFAGVPLAAANYEMLRGVMFPGGRAAGAPVSLTPPRRPRA
jgi:predicted NAD/FAD-binding protein